MNGKENLMTIKRHALMMIAALAFMMIFLIPATMTSVHAEGELRMKKLENGADKKRPFSNIMA
ncbi:hypothetical protein [Pseudoramibacter alactolyticus]|uniref:hypothetical protein n=1 Tax=Pseudoramibacter alactolyticus TaxID=113287 RepID=UPI0028EA664A|nr:hypothetical protein [Pseudoramibacter alactolyticus]